MALRLGDLALLERAVVSHRASRDSRPSPVPAARDAWIDGLVKVVLDGARPATPKATPARPRRTPSRTRPRTDASEVPTR